SSHLPRPPAPRPRVEQLRGAGRPRGRAHRDRDRPACRAGAVQAIAGRARPDVDLRRDRRSMDRRRPGRLHRHDGRGARMTDPTPPPPRRPPPPPPPAAPPASPPPPGPEDAARPAASGEPRHAADPATEGFESDPTAWPPHEAFDANDLDDRGW